MVKLNKIYTRTGDKGTTGLVDGSRVAKHAVRMEASGTVDDADNGAPTLLSVDAVDHSVRTSRALCVSSNSGRSRLPTRRGRVMNGAGLQRGGQGPRRGSCRGRSRRPEYGRSRRSDCCLSAGAI